MFDREGFAAYVGTKSGATYVTRLGNIESLYDKDIDAEYDKDKCGSLLLYLQGLREAEGVSTRCCSSMTSHCWVLDERRDG